METYMSMRRTIERDAKRIQKIKRDNIGRYTKKEKQYQEMFRNIQMIFAVLFLLGFGIILIKPIEMHNPLVGIETIHAAESKSNDLIIPIDQADQTDRRIEECWEKGHTPGVMAKGFQCAAPATEVSAQLVALVKATFPENPVTACAIAYGESLNNPNGINHSKIEHSVGIMQINLMKPSTGKHIHWDKAEGNTLEDKTEWLKVPANNMKVARQIYERQGFQPWVAFTGGSYKNHLSKCN